MLYCFTNCCSDCAGISCYEGLGGRHKDPESTVRVSGGGALFPRGGDSRGPTCQAPLHRTNEGPGDGLALVGTSRYDETLGGLLGGRQGGDPAAHAHRHGAVLTGT